MNARDQGGAECCVNGAVTRNTIERLQTRRADRDREMRFPRAIIPGVTSVFEAVIDHLETVGGKSGKKPITNVVSNWHI